MDIDPAIMGAVVYTPQRMRKAAVHHDREADGRPNCARWVADFDSARSQSAVLAVSISTMRHFPLMVGASNGLSSILNSH